MLQKSFLGSWTAPLFVAGGGAQWSVFEKIVKNLKIVKLERISTLSQLAQLVSKIKYFI